MAVPDEAPEITIVLADDHRVVRSGLRLLLQGEPGMHVVGETGDVPGVLRMVEMRKPDVLVLDLNMPGRRSLPAIPIDPIAQWPCRSAERCFAHWTLSTWQSAVGHAPTRAVPHPIGPAEPVTTSVTTSRSSNAAISSTRLDDLDAPARSGRN